MVAGTAGVILAGGQSRRMGRNKALLRLTDASPTLIETIAQQLATVTSALHLVTNAPQLYAKLDFPANLNFVADNFPGAGPLAGLEAGLDNTLYDYVLLVACDMPWLAEPLLRYLLSFERDGWDALVLLNQDGLPEPLCAVYSRAALPVARAHLAAGHYKMADFLAAIRTKFVAANEWAAYDPAGQSFRNLNTPQDLEQILNVKF